MMAIKNILLALLAIGTGSTNGLAFEAPTATAFQQGWQFNGLGWTPAPTSAPEVPHDILKRGLLAERQLASTVLMGADQTCGYLSGRAGALYTCGDPTSTCNFIPAISTRSYGMVACCAKGQCYGRLYCINSSQYYSQSACNDVCQANTFTLKCTYSNAPYCNTAVWPDIRVSDVYCAASSVSTIQTISTTYSGQTSGGTFSAVALPDDDTTFVNTRSSSTTRRVVTTSSDSSTSSIGPSPTPTPPTPTPIPNPDPPSSTPTGAIVGGVVGGVALIAAIAFGLFFVRRRNRRDKEKKAAAAAAATDGYNSQPPPVYLPTQPEMDGANAGVGKTGMTQSYFAPVPAPGGQPQYNQYQQESLSPGSVSAIGEGTYDPRRESTASPVSPRTQRASMAGSPQMSEVYVNTGGQAGYPPPPAVGSTYEMGSSSPIAHEMPGSVVPPRQ